MSREGPQIETTIQFIADIELYQEEKPFFLHLSATVEDDERIQTSNVQWDTKPLTIHSMRDNTDITLERNGFCYIQHESKYLPRPSSGLDAVTSYRQESEELVRDLFNAEFVHCYDCKLRKNSPMSLESYDPNDPLLVEQVALGAHVGENVRLYKYRSIAHILDISIDTVPKLLKNILSEEQIFQYFQTGYRFRLVNTWRSTLPECKDQPLALCDYSSTEPEDLVATDRIYPTWNQEIYHLKFNKNQRWYWLPNQRADEPFLFMTFDSHAGSNARCKYLLSDETGLIIDLNETVLMSRFRILSQG